MAVRHLRRTVLRGGPHQARPPRQRQPPSLPPPRAKAKCEHGRKVACWFRHPETELRTVGRPLCDDCFDWTGLALWNALAPELWRRTLGVTIYRTLAHLLSTSEAEVKRLVRYTKVAEYQARAAIHFHAVIRLDAAPPRGDPEQVAPPPPGFTAELLAEAVKAAAATVAVPYPQLDPDAAGRLARWGEQLDVRNVTRDGTDLSAEAVAAYIAKYATKSTEALAGLDRRIHADDDLDHRKASPISLGWSGSAGSSGRTRPWPHCGCASGRTRSGSGATGRPGAAATPPPSPHSGVPGWCTRSAGGCAGLSRWTPGAAGPPRRPPWCLAPGASSAGATATTTAPTWP